MSSSLNVEPAQIVISAARGAQGYKGDPGGNVMSVGVAMAVANMVIPDGTDIIQVSGYSVPGIGRASYATSSDQTSPVGPGRIKDNAGRYFDLQVDVLGVTPEQFGAMGNCVHSPSANTTTGTVDDQAFLDAISFCMRRGNNSAWSLYLSRNYLITKNNILGQWVSPTGQFVRGFKIFGPGFGAASITFMPSGSDGVTSYYLRDGLASAGSATIASAMLSFQMEGLTLYTDNSNLTTQTVGYFRQSGWSADSNPEQGWLFRDVNFSADTGSAARIALNGSVLDIVGTANCSENSFENCRGLCNRSIVNCTNPQAVNHKSSFSHWEVIQGDAFNFVRGGALVVTGGSLIMDNTGQITAWAAGATVAAGTVRYYDGVQYVTSAGGTTGTTPPTHLTGTVSDGGVSWTFVANESRFLLGVGGDNAGQINFFSFYGVRIELRSCRGKLVRAGNATTRAAEANTSSKINFHGCDMAAVSGGFRTTIDLVECNVAVDMVDCFAPAVNGWQAIVVKFAPSGGASGDIVRATGGPKVKLTDCQVTGVIHSYISWGLYSSGRFSMRGCLGNPTLPGTTDLTTSPDILMDCDMFNPAQAGFSAKGSPGSLLKAMFINFRSLPGGNSSSVNPDGKQSSWRFPPGSYFKAIQVIKQAGGGANAVAASYAVKSLTTSTTIATLPAVTSVAAGFNVGVDVDTFIFGGDVDYALVDTGTANPGSITRQAGDGILIFYV